MNLLPDPSNLLKPVDTLRTQDQLAGLFSRYLARNLNISGQETMNDAVQHIMSNTGKMLRPSLLLMACDMFGGDIKKAIPSAMAIEYFHNFTLVHDDIMDESELRRGKETLHIKYNRNTAILAGDMMFIHAYKLLAGSDPEHLNELIHSFNLAAMRVIEGQEMDMQMEQEMEVAEDDYIRMISYKTAALFAASMRMGAVCAGAKAEDLQHIFHFANYLGITFQLKDDYLDTFGDGEVFGKKIGGDIIQNKHTYLMVSALRGANFRQMEELKELRNCEDRDKKVKETTRLFIETGAKARTERMMQKYYAEAFRHLFEIAIPYERKSEVMRLAEKIYQREK